MMRNIWTSFVVTFILGSLSAVAAPKIQDGSWLFELQTNNSVVPFIVDLNWKGQELTGVIHNGKEKINLGQLKIKKDKLIIPVQSYEITIELEVNNGKKMTGHLIRHNKNPISKNMVTATYGIKERFPIVTEIPKKDFSGRYSVTILDEDGKSSPGVLVLTQKQMVIDGSLLTPTGDYRYFEGQVIGNEFVAASFDGMFNYIIRGSIIDGNFEGTLLTNYKLKLSGKFDPKAELPDAYAQTQIDKLSFAFPDVNGKFYSLESPKLKNKPVIVQFFGSWCPNCHDEMNYLIPWYEKNHKRGIEVVALSFERSLDHDAAKMQLKKVVKQKKIPYVVLLAGSTAEEKPMDKIKGLKNFISFPTTIFLNRKHEVVKIHAGFSGPGTGEFYQKWIKEFNETTEKLLKKK